MRFGWLAALAMVVWAPAGSAGSPAELRTLLDAAAPEQDARERGRVDVAAWIDRGDANPAVVISLAPEGEAKLVADPGIVVTPEPRDGLVWLEPVPKEVYVAGADYFETPPLVRMPFANEDGAPIDLFVEYAYCIVEFQCLFGEANVTVATAAP